MTPIDQDVRDLLRRRADDVPTHGEVPASLGRRVRRRIAVNAALAGAVAVVLAAGAFASVRAFTGSAPQPVGSTPPPAHASQPAPSRTPATSPTGGRACTSADLRAAGALAGAAGSREGSIRITNQSGTACSLQGTPTITLLDQNGNPITSGVAFSTAPAWWQKNNASQPAGWPVVTIDPGAVASFQIQWSNWCPQGRPSPTWRIAIPGGGTVDVTGMDTLAGSPPCNGPGQPSTVSVGPFEPGPGG